MPLIGVKCDDPNHHGECFSFAECLNCAKTGGPRRCDNALPLIAGMAMNMELRKDAGLSATMLLDCPRKHVLAAEHDYHEHPRDFWARFRGTMSHALMESYDPDDENIIQEVRFQKVIEIDGTKVKVTGKPDFIDLTRKLIVDYKSVGSLSKVKNGPKEGHEEQLNVYRWLLAGGTNMTTKKTVNYEIDKLGLQYFDMSGQKKHRVRVWTIEEADEFVAARAKPYAHWQATGELPEILVDAFGDRDWRCDHRWCVLRDICDARAAGTLQKGESLPRYETDESSE